VEEAVSIIKYYTFMAFSDALSRLCPELTYFLMKMKKIEVRFVEKSIYLANNKCK